MAPPTGGQTVEERGREGFSCPSWRKFLAYVCLSFSSPPSLSPISFLPHLSHPRSIKRGARPRRGWRKGSREMSWGRREGGPIAPPSVHPSPAAAIICQREGERREGNFEGLFARGKGRKGTYADEKDDCGGGGGDDDAAFYSQCVWLGVYVRMGHPRLAHDAAAMPRCLILSPEGRRGGERGGIYR